MKDKLIPIVIVVAWITFFMGYFAAKIDTDIKLRGRVVCIFIPVGTNAITLEKIENHTAFTNLNIKFKY